MLAWKFIHILLAYNKITTVIIIVTIKVTSVAIARGSDPTMLQTLNKNNMYGLEKMIIVTFGIVYICTHIMFI